MSRVTIAKVATVLALIGAVSFTVNHLMTGQAVDWMTLLGAFTAVCAAFGFQSFASLGRNDDAHTKNQS